MQIRIWDQGFQPFFLVPVAFSTLINSVRAAVRISNWVIAGHRNSANRGSAYRTLRYSGSQRLFQKNDSTSWIAVLPFISRNCFKIRCSTLAGRVEVERQCQRKTATWRLFSHLTSVQSACGLGVGLPFVAPRAAAYNCQGWVWTLAESTRFLFCRRDGSRPLFAGRDKREYGATRSNGSSP